MKNEILNLLILGGYTFEEVATIFEISVKEVKRIYSDAL
tara:strand:+ start:846 stop:962 length:117 start_codon:yes stop_codon:yes gene_type:complete